MLTKKSKSTYWIIGIVCILMLFIKIGNSYFNPKRNNDLSKIDLSEIDKSKIFKKSFKKFLKEKNISMDIGVKNEYETLQTNNTYTNHYFNIATDFPDKWLYDRGMSDYAIFRAFVRDSGFTISLIAIPIILKENESIKSIQEEFQKDPITYINKSYNNNYSSYIINQLKTQTNHNVYDFEMNSETVRTTNYLKYFYKYDEIVDNETIPFKICTYQTILWGINYTFTYGAPETFYNQHQIDEVIFRTNYINPNL